MSTDRARRFAEHLQTIFDGAESAANQTPSVSQALSRQEMRAIDTVGQESCCPMNRLARAICSSLSTATGLVDRLFEKRLVRRDRSSDDRRVVHVELTEEGRKLHEAASAARADFARGALATLNASEQEQLVALLAKVSKHLKEQGGA